MHAVGVMFTNWFEYDEGEPKNSKSTGLEFFYPSRRLGISSDASRYIIKGGEPPLYLITRQRASSLRLDDIQTFGLMIYRNK